MRVIVQRVLEASVYVDKTLISHIDQGFLVYVGIHESDTDDVVLKMATKIKNLRIFEDEQGKMNLNLSQVNGKILAVSQFTLYGDTKGNNRPSFILAARPEIAVKRYDLLCDELSKSFVVEKGVFQAHMNIISNNDGPVTILIEM